MQPLKHILTVIAALIALLASEASTAQFRSQYTDEEVDQFIRSDPKYQASYFKALDSNEQRIFVLIDLDRGRIALARYVIDSLKKGPQLKTDELRWLLDIEDRLLKADRDFVASQTFLLLSSENLTKGQSDRAQTFRQQSAIASINKVAEASGQLEKAMRELDALAGRVEGGEGDQQK